MAVHVHPHVPTRTHGCLFVHLDLPACFMLDACLFVIDCLFVLVRAASWRLLGFRAPRSDRELRCQNRGHDRGLSSPRGGDRRVGCGPRTRDRVRHPAIGNRYPQDAGPKPSQNLLTRDALISRHDFGDCPFKKALAGQKKTLGVHTRNARDAQILRREGVSRHLRPAASTARICFTRRAAVAPTARKPR